MMNESETGNTDAQRGARFMSKVFLKVLKAKLLN